MKMTKDNMQRTARFSFLFALMYSLFCTCQSPLDPPKSEDAGGRAIIRIGNASNRSLVPTTAPVFSKYELVFSAEGKNTVSKTLESESDRTAINGSGYAVDLVEAAWTITVTASVSNLDNSGYLDAAQGTGSFTVSSAISLSGETGSLELDSGYYDLALTLTAGGARVPESTGQCISIQD
jgi:hypothetical protein